MDLKKYTVAELKEIIRNYNLHHHISCFSTMKKDELIKVIHDFTEFVDEKLVGKSHTVKVPKITAREKKPRATPTQKLVEATDDKSKNDTKISKQQSLQKLKEWKTEQNWIKEPNKKILLEIVRNSKKHPEFLSEINRTYLVSYINRFGNSDDKHILKSYSTIIEDINHLIFKTKDKIDVLNSMMNQKNDSRGTVNTNPKFWKSYVDKVKQHENKLKKAESLQKYIYSNGLNEKNRKSIDDKIAELYQTKFTYLMIQTR